MQGRSAARKDTPGSGYRGPEVLVIGETVEPSLDLMVSVEFPLLAQGAIPIEITCVHVLTLPSIRSLCQDLGTGSSELLCLNWVVADASCRPQSRENP